jgi:phosphatidylserine/phosphatidylglycerophosphate/cardiolipin synthase-like enzyme
MIMFGKGDLGNTYYYGSDTHRFINELIGRKGEIMLVSPYIDRYYAEALLRKSRGRKFYLISSSVEEDVLGLLRGGSPLWIIAYLGLSMILLGLLLFVGATGAALLLSLVPFAVGIIRGAGRGSGVILKVPKQFVHVKMYISEGMAITGSANLTYKGTHKNVEQINIIYNKSDIEKLKEQFWSMWNKL